MNTEILTNLIITKMLSATTIYTEGDCKRKKMHRTRWGIVQKSEGETEYVLNGKVYTSDKTHMVILPKGTDYEWKCKKSGHYTIVEFDSDFVYDDIMCFEISENLSERLLHTMKEMEYRRNVKSQLCELECIRDTYGIILSLAETTNKVYCPSEKTEKIRAAVDYIAKHYNTQITNDLLAEMCGISAVYFRKLFSEIYGMSPISYVHSVRIKKAKDMLLIDYSSISSVADSLGYPSIYDFSRAFKRYTGLSPKNYVMKEKGEI